MKENIVAIAPALIKVKEGVEVVLCWAALFLAPLAMTLVAIM